MVSYNPKDWWRLIFAFHKSDTFRMMLPGIIGVAVFTGLITYLEREILKTSFTNTTAIHALVGFALSLLLVFRTNTAYDRWWEGRKVWGSFVNNSRNLSLKLSVIGLDESERSMFAALISNYIYAAKEHLRSGVIVQNLIMTEKYDLSYYANMKHIPNRVMKAIYTEIEQLYKAKRISGEQLLTMNAELASFTDNIGMCERIKNTPIPYSYSLYLKKMIFLYVFSMPIGFAQEFGYYSMPIVAVVFYVFGSIELLAEEIEDPFGTDANDLPTDTIYENISIHIREILA